MTKLPKSNFGQSARHFELKDCELKSRERCAALRPIASVIKHRIIKIAHLISFVANPVPSVFNKGQKMPDLSLHRHPFVRILTLLQGWQLVYRLSHITSNTGYVALEYTERVKGP